MIGLGLGLGTLYFLKMLDSSHCFKSIHMIIPKIFLLQNV